MTKTNTTLFTKSDFQNNCVNHAELATALCALIDVKANYEAIELLADELRQQADFINSHSRFVDVVSLESVAV